MFFYIILKFLNQMDLVDLPTLPYHRSFTKLFCYKTFGLRKHFEDDIKKMFKFLTDNIGVVFIQSLIISFFMIGLKKRRNQFVSLS